MKYFEAYQARRAKLTYLRKSNTFERKNKQFFNLKDAKSIGIIYDRVDEKKTAKMLELLEKFQDHKLVKALAYLPNLEDKEKQKPYINIQYFSNEDTKRYGKPKLAQLKYFMTYAFDILLDFCEGNELPTLYVANFSNAKFKAGIYSKEKDFLDFLIKNGSFCEAITHTLDYLNRIK